VQQYAREILSEKEKKPKKEDSKKKGKAEKEPSCKLFIMTSDVTHDKTVSFFVSKKYFGLHKSDVIFFKQGSLPTLTFEGKFQFETRTKIAQGPNGNGALFEALRNNKSLFEAIDANKIEYLHMIGIDNVLNKVLDPFFLGFTIQKDLKVAAKVIGKRSPDEALGVFAQVNGLIDVIEYSEIGKQQAEECFSDGELVYNEGNILNFILHVDTMRDIVLSEKRDQMNSLYHVAIKKLPYYCGEEDRIVKPD
jgi:UDP-N-acetylglucosamine/UDP-N-acetylgalactosamine diphosphorylase